MASAAALTEGGVTKGGTKQKPQLPISYRKPAGPTALVTGKYQTYMTLMNQGMLL